MPPRSVICFLSHISYQATISNGNTGTIKTNRFVSTPVITFLFLTRHTESEPRKNKIVYTISQVKKLNSSPRENEITNAVKIVSNKPVSNDRKKVFTVVCLKINT